MKKVLLGMLITVTGIAAITALALKFALPDYLFDPEFIIPRD